MAFPLCPIIPADTEQWRIRSALAAEFRSWRHFIHAVAWMKPAFECLRSIRAVAISTTAPTSTPALHTSGNRSSQQRGSAQRRLQPVRKNPHQAPHACLHHLPLRLQRSLHGTHHSPLPFSSSSTSSCHLIQISELAGVFVCTSICLSDGREERGSRPGQCVDRKA